MGCYDAGNVPKSYNRYWNLVDAAGFSANLLDAKQEKGNIIAMQLLVGGLMLQPCNPTFLQARDAILQADQAYYSSKYKCAIWKAFAKRGMGVDATGVYRKQAGLVDGFKVPETCA
jgi:extracellular elastinolytic metalloproteinase